MKISKDSRISPCKLHNQSYMQSWWDGQSFYRRGTVRKEGGGGQTTKRRGRSHTYPLICSSDIQNTKGGEDRRFIQLLRIKTCVLTISRLFQQESKHSESVLFRGEGGPGVAESVSNNI